MIHPLQMMELMQQLYMKLEEAEQYIGISLPKHREMCLAHLRTAMRMVSQVPRDTPELQDDLYSALQDIYQVFLWMREEVAKDWEWSSAGRKGQDTLQNELTIMNSLCAELLDCLDTVRDALGLIDNVREFMPPLYMESPQ